MQIRQFSIHQWRHRKSAAGQDPEKLQSQAPQPVTWLLHALPKAHITIYAEKFGSDLTSHGAAGVWQPYKLSETPEVLTYRWGKETFDHLVGLVHSDEAVQSGVEMMYVHSLHLAPEPEPFWAPSVVCEGRLYLRWLSDRLEAAGVQFVQRRLSTLAELTGEGWDVVVNCSGLGAQQLLPDPHCYPIRGQIMRVKAPWVNQCVFADFPDETTYIIPNRMSNVNICIDAQNANTFAAGVVPSLKHAELVDHWVGLRPGRVRLRLEGEELSLAALEAAAEAAGADLGVLRCSGSTRVQGLRVVHNYGHGGSGLTLAWGTAGDAVQLILQMLQLQEAGSESRLLSLDWTLEVCTAVLWLSILPSLQAVERISSKQPVFIQAPLLVASTFLQGAQIISCPIQPTGLQEFSDVMHWGFHQLLNGVLGDTAHATGSARPLAAAAAAPDPDTSILTTTLFLLLFGGLLMPLFLAYIMEWQLKVSFLLGECPSGAARLSILTPAAAVARGSVFLAGLLYLGWLLLMAIASWAVCNTVAAVMKTPAAVALE
eukprot:gene12186-12323_t